ncbi:MAG: hypothetical protein RIC35_05480 [Marinoscillum sp.]
MIYKNGIDLSSNLHSFLKEVEDYAILVPYIKNDKFRELLNHNPNCSQVVVRWLPMDLITQASDLEVYDTCKDFGITLYRNPRLHLKAFTDMSQCFMGSANISKRAMADATAEGYNYEIATTIERIDFEAKVYFQKILMESVLVTEYYVNQIKEQLENIDASKPPGNFTDQLERHNEDPFLLSALPMTSTVKTLVEIYCGNSDYGEEEMNCAAHDLALYKVPLRLGRGEFIEHLDRAFNKHPFVMALKGHIESLPKQSLNYGGVVRWIQENTTTVPTPRPWELKQKQLVNVLYDWICEFDGAFYWDRPNHSQVIYKIR